MTTLPAGFRDRFEATGVVLLTTNGGDGYPQTTAVWYLLDEGKIKISLNTARQKVRNLRVNPKATLYFIDPVNEHRTVEIRADVELIDDSAYAVTDRVSAKYGADLRALDKGQPGSRVIAIFNPVKINASGV